MAQLNSYHGLSESNCLKRSDLLATSKLWVERSSWASRSLSRLTWYAQWQEGGRGAGRTLDVRDAAQCDAVVAAVQKEFGDILVLVNNAAVVRDNLAMRMKDAEWDEVIETDLRSVFRLSRAVMRGMMKARWGRMVNITSVVGAAGNPGQANYAAAKAGLSRMAARNATSEAARRAITSCST